jgi:ribosomal protein S18 acetylase RimI-like enzyme
VGYISARVEQSGKVGRIGLVGIGPNFRQKGIGSLLLQTALEWFTSQSVTIVRVVTQGGNVAAQRLYQRFGFKMISIHLWYHKWFVS